MINDLYKCNSCFQLGILAENEDDYPTIGLDQKSITVFNNSSEGIFYVKPITYKPEPVRKWDDFVKEMDLSNLYIGIDQYQQTFLPVEYKHITNINEKIEKLRELLEGKVILFRPRFNIKNKNDKEKIYKNLEIVSIEQDVYVSPEYDYVPIPKIDMDAKSFENRLKNEESFLLRDYNHIMLPPEYIICGDYLYSEFFKWDKPEDNDRLWIHYQPNHIKKIKIDLNSSDLKGHLVKASNHLVFMDGEYIKKSVTDRIETEGANLFDDDEQNKEDTFDYVENNNYYSSEIQFLDKLKEDVTHKQLCYDKGDLVNFHTSVKTNFLTIIAGMSGTGKTQLALSYAKSLGLTEDNRTLLILPVSPAYTEPGDVLGYLNVMSGLYVPAETGLVDFLINARNKPETMHMVVFDEMNLSQIEHWFAPFISLLEKKEDRKLTLYSERGAVCHNNEKYPPDIEIKDNVLFVGTVNMDETTKDFSDRLLDRANIVTLKKMPLRKLKEEQDYLKQKTNIDENLPQDFFNTTVEYRSWVDNTKKSLSAYKIEELEFLDRLHDLINEYDGQKGVSFRIFERMGNYLNNIPCDQNNIPLLSREDAIDIQIKQR
jgi:hypothetical protein